jgi:hypothetical protein
MSGEPLEEEERRRREEEARRILEEGGALEAVRRGLRVPDPARPLSAESAEPQGMFRTPLEELPEARVVSSTRAPMPPPVRAQAPVPPPPSLEQQTREVEAPPRQIENARAAEAVGDAYRAGRPEPYRAEPSDFEMEDLRVGRPGATAPMPPTAVSPPAGVRPTAGGAVAPAAPPGAIRDQLRAVLERKYGAPLQSALTRGRSVRQMGGDEGLAPTGAAAQLGNPSAPLPPPPGTGLVRQWDGPEGAKKPPMATQTAPELPQARDYTGIDVADAIARPFRGIARGLLYASGHSPGPIASWGQQARTEDRQRLADALRQRQEQAQVQRSGTADELARERLGLERERMTQAGEERAADRDLRARMQERAAELRASGMGEQEALSRARREALQSEMSRAAALRDAQSPESAQARQAFLGEVELAQTSGWQLPPALRAQLPQMSGEQIERLSEGLTAQGILRPYTHRRGGARSGGGGGGGGRTDSTPRAAWGTDADPVMQSAVEQGVPEAVARGLVSSPSERNRLLRTLAQGSITSERGEQGRTEANVEDLGRALDAQLVVSRAAQHAQQMIRSASDTEIRAAFMGGSIGSLAPARIQELRSAVNELQAQVIRERSGASVSDSEFDRMRSELGAMPTQSPQVFRHWVDRSVSVARDMRGRIRSRYDDDVIGTYEQRLQREGVDVGSAQGDRPRQSRRPVQRTAPTAPVATGSVRLRRPDGVIMRVPEASAQRYIRLGATRLDQ